MKNKKFFTSLNKFYYNILWWSNYKAVHSLAHVNKSYDLNSLTEYEPISKLTKIYSVYVWHLSTEKKLPPVPELIYKTISPIENCPTCEIGLVPEQFTVNVETSVMKTACQYGLTIKIKIQPPSLKVAVVQKKINKNELH